MKQIFFVVFRFSFWLSQSNESIYVRVDFALSWRDGDYVPINVNCFHTKTFCFFNAFPKPIHIFSPSPCQSPSSPQPSSKIKILQTKFCLHSGMNTISSDTHTKAFRSHTRSIQKISKVNGHIITGQGFVQDIGIGMGVQTRKTSTDILGVLAFCRETHGECGSVQTANGVYI